MKVLVTCERRYLRSPDGKIWTPSIDDALFWARYLAVFDEVIVLSRVEDCAEAQSRWRAVEAERIKVMPFPTEAKNFILNYFGLREMLKAVLAESSAVIIRGPGTMALYFYLIFGFFAYPFALEMTGDPHQMFAKGSFQHPLRRLIQFIFGNFTRHLAAHADVAAYVTQRSLQAKYPSNANAYSAAYSSISLDDAAFVHAEQASSTETISLISVGSIEKLYKGFAELLQAIASCRNKRIRLKIVGGGAALPELMALAQELQLAVEFTGELAGPELVRKQMRGADCFILLSKSEGLPRVLIEAMALALPCIASNVGGIPELLDSEFLVNPNDIPAVAEAIDCLIDKRGEWAEIGAANQKKATEFHERILSAKRKEMYEELLRRTENRLRKKQK
jgi:phosphatidyl-myo-inositol dimannoside synthase